MMKPMGFAIFLSVCLVTYSFGQTASTRTPSLNSRTERMDLVATSSVAIGQMVRCHGRVGVFVGSSPETGVEVWVTNGTEEGTGLLADIAPGPAGSNPQGFIQYQDEVFFYADDGVHGVEVWRTDGTRAGTKMLKDSVPGAEGIRPTGMTIIDHRLHIPVDSGHGGKLSFYVLSIATRGGETSE